MTPNPTTPEDLAWALEKCRLQFEKYARSHEAKGTPEASIKAAANISMVSMIHDVLTAYRTAQAQEGTTPVQGNEGVLKALQTISELSIHKDFKSPGPLYTAGLGLGLRIAQDIAKDALIWRPSPTIADGAPEALAALERLVVRAATYDAATATECEAIIRRALLGEGA